MNRLILDLNINLCWGITESREERIDSIPFAAEAKKLLDSTNPQFLIEKLLADHPFILYPTMSNYGWIIFWSRTHEAHEDRRNSPDSILALRKKVDQIQCELFEELIIEARTVRDLYYACMQARNTPEFAKNSLAKCKLLHSAYDCARQIQAITEKRISKVPPDVLSEANLDIDRIYGTLLNLPAMVDFRRFLSIYEDDFRSKYGFKVRKTKPHKDSRTKTSILPEYTSNVTLNYWDNRDASKDVQLALDVFGYRLNQEHKGEKEYTNYFTEWVTAKELSDTYLSILDQFISARLGSVDFHFDSVNRELICTVSSLESAIYLRIISDIVSTRDYKECVMCGCLFEATRNNKKYCFRHTDSQINYYRILKRNLKKSSTIEEDSET